MSYGFDDMDDSAFWDEADRHVKSEKEEIVEGVACKCCERVGVVSRWDLSTRDGFCADCFWGRCPKGDDCKTPNHMSEF